MTKKYGGLAPKKKPLISKDHERAFFDSADWALCKRTPHHTLPPRRPACTSGSNVSLDMDRVTCRLGLIECSDQEEI
ncbi:hypothetical protein POTOM_031544 [Populus tomentosa]|nr:hypothetical protein POTOM_031544 [Populus tomentosa]